jgi:hypothetical protein
MKRKRQRREDSSRREHAAQVAGSPRSRRSRGGSVKSLQLQGIDNGALYELAATNYDLCLTRDAEFSRRVQSRPLARLKLVHVIIPQTRQNEFVQQFLVAFRETDWSSHNSGDDWPR